MFITCLVMIQPPVLAILWSIIENSAIKNMKQVFMGKNGKMHIKKERKKKIDPHFCLLWNDCHYPHFSPYMVHSEIIPIQRSKCQLLWKATEILMMNECVTFQTHTLWNLTALPEKQPQREPWSYPDESPRFWPCKAMSHIYRSMFAGGSLIPLTDLHLDQEFSSLPCVACRQPCSSRRPEIGLLIGQESRHGALQRPAVV